MISAYLKISERRHKHIDIKSKRNRQPKPITYDKQQAEQMLANGFYCYRYKIKMSNRLSCFYWATAYNNELGKIHEECAKCPNYEHILNMKEYADVTKTQRQARAKFSTP